MKNLLLAVALAAACAALPAFSQTPDTKEMARLAKEAQRVTIIRDDWGIAHVYGHTDADAVFGAEYAQAEDDFNRVETNYINALGRLAEAEGEDKIWQDLRMKLFIDPVVLRQQYAQAPDWLKQLMNAFADGLNYYLAKHPETHPRVITHFEPWMALAFSEGSIGGDIEKVNLRELQAFYGDGGSSLADPAADPQSDNYLPPEPGGSNGIAIAPANTVDHHALLLINPHTSFYFRSELQMVSDQGLDAYGASTWGQFFIYQGFNPRVGWMHTSSGVDAVDNYLETVTKKGDAFFYKYGDQELPVASSVITIPYKTAMGMSERKFTVYRTQHGPVVRSADGKWVAIRLMNEPLKALIQSYTRTKATDYKSFRQTMELHTNSSNNTIFADSDGDIAYFHANFIPTRDAQFDWTKPVDGSNPATNWGPLMSVDATPRLLNPATGWIYNSNNWPWSAAGASSPKRADFPAYVDTGKVESPRGLHAVRLLENKKDFTLDGLMAAAFDSYQPWFGKTIPALVKAWDAAPDSDPLKAQLAEPIALLRGWDDRWAADSVPTSVAVYWGSAISRQAGAAARRAGIADYDYIASGQVPPDQLLQALATGVAKLTADFGTWKTPWGDINRFQRRTDDLVEPFSDAAPSIPVEFTTATWGSLASFAARSYNGSKKIYGTSGNSFVAVVEFGPTIHAKAITAGGESGNPSSPHFADEAQRYATGNLREVYFYRSQLIGHTARTYHPGE